MPFLSPSLLIRLLLAESLDMNAVLEALSRVIPRSATTGNSTHSFGQLSSTGSMALAAARTNDTEYIQNLLETGFDINYVSPSGNTLLESAIMGKYEDLCLFLIVKGANVQHYNPHLCASVGVQSSRLSVHSCLMCMHRLVASRSQLPSIVFKSFGKCMNSE